MICANVEVNVQYILYSLELSVFFRSTFRLSRWHSTDGLCS